MQNQSQKPQRKPLKILAIIFSSLFLLASAFLAYCLISTSILPLLYLIISLSVLGIFAFLLLFFSIKKSKSNRPYILTLIFSIILSTVIGFIIYYFATTMNFFQKISSPTYKIEKFYLLSLKDSSFSSESDLTSHSIAVYTNPSASYADAKSKLTSRISFEEKLYPDYFEAASALITRETDAFLIQDAFKDIISEALSDFKDENLIIISTIEIKTEESTEEIPDIDVSAQPFSIFISGIDTYGPISTVSRSDVNMLVTINPVTHEILLTSIPRDYYVQLHGTTGPKDKLTHAGIYGVEMSKSTIEDLFDTKIDYYFRVNFSTLVSLVDSIGGIDITSDTYFSKNGCTFYANRPTHLSGACALVFSRERKVYATGDRHRVENQQLVLSAIIDKLTSDKSLIMNYPDLLSSLESSFQTNLPSSKIYRLINLQLSEMPSWKIDRYSVNGAGSMDVTYSTGSQILYVMIPDETTIEAAKEKINSILNPAPEESTEISE